MRGSVFGIRKWFELNGIKIDWAKLKERLNVEGANELLTNCQQLNIQAEDGKMRQTDVADATQVLCAIQFVHLSKAC